MVLYRAEMRNFEEIFNPIIKFDEYLVIKETNCGFWIRKISKDSNKKFCLKGDGKRFAHQTKEQALEYFIHRRALYHSILKQKIEGNKMVMKLAQEYKKDINHKPKQEYIF